MQVKIIVELNVYQYCYHGKILYNNVLIQILFNSFNGKDFL